MTPANLVRVGDIAEQIRGVSYGKADAVTAPAAGYVPVLRAGNITNTGLVFNDLVYVPSNKVSSKQKILKGDIVIAASSGSLDVVGKAALAKTDCEGGFGAFCKVLRPNPAIVEPGYFAHFFQTREYRRKISSLAAGANINNLKNEHLDDLLIPIPQRTEQRRIATILDQADTLCTKRREALTQLDKLTQSIFIEMFGDPISNSKGWPKMAFGTACPSRLGKMLDQKQQSGKHLRKYLRNANVQWFRFDLNEVFEMDFDESARETFRLTNGDLLICEGGEPGRAAIWRNELDDCCYQKALHRGRPNPNLAKSEYLVWLLWFLAKSGGLSDHVTSATIAHLTGEKLKVMKIPLPPLELQNEFVVRLDQVSKLKTDLENSATQLDNLFSSLQHRAFRGEL